MINRPLIIVQHQFLQIPTRRFDYIAFRDGTTDDGIFGYGETEPMARAMLIVIEGDSTNHPFEETSQ